MKARVRIVQPLIPKYREPVFAALARRSDIDLEVWADLEWQHSSLRGASGSDAFKCVHAPYRAIGPFAWQPAMLRAVDRNVDAVVFTWNSRCVQLRPALTKARSLGVRTVLWGHGIGKHETPMRRRFRNALIRRADACLLYSPALAQKLVDEGFERSLVFVATNSVDQAPIRAAKLAWPAPRVDEFLAERGCSRGRVVLFVGRLEPEKRVDRLIDAFARVRERVPDARLVIVGDGPERGALESRGSGARFEGAIYDEQQLAPWMLGAACLAHPRGIGLSMLHAFGYGVPVITSDDRLPHGPEIEALRDGANGFLYRDGDMDSLAQRIVSLLTNIELQRRLGAAALDTVERANGWNIDAMVDGFVAAIKGQPTSSPPHQRGRD